MQAVPLLRPAALALVCAGCTLTHAQDTPPITVSASYAVQTDDNPLRLSEDFVAPVGYQPIRSEQVGISTLGLLFHTVQGLQQFELDANLVNYRYQDHSSPDYTAHNLAAAWHWAVTPRLRGNLSANQQELPNAISGDTGPNQQTQTTYRADLDYQLGGPWHLLAGSTQDKLSKQIATAGGQEYSSHTLDAGLRYEKASGSTAQVRIKATEGSYTNVASTPFNALDDQFEQLEAELRLHWAFSAASSADIYATPFQRRHPHVGTRDFSGVNGGASVLWAISALTSLYLGYQHDLAAYATNNTNYSASDQLTWDWRWQTSVKSHLALGQTLAKIAYRGSPGAALASERSDGTRDTHLTWTWQPRTALQLSAGLHQIQRSSTDAALAYTSNQFSISAQLSF